MEVHRSGHIDGIDAGIGQRRVVIGIDFPAAEIDGKLPGAFLHPVADGNEPGVGGFLKRRGHPLPGDIAAAHQQPSNHLVVHLLLPFHPQSGDRLFHCPGDIEDILPGRPGEDGQAEDLSAPFSASGQPVGPYPSCRITSQLQTGG